MIRTLIGGLVGGLLIFILGYVFWATPLGDIPYSHATDAQNAAVQTALAQNLTRHDTKTGQISGTGTYIIPDYHSAGGAVLHGNGPIATVHYNTSGFSAEDMSMLLPGFIVALIAGLLMAFGLSAVAEGRSFESLARLVICVSLAFCVWEFLGSPIFNHFGWGYWIYAFVAESVSLIVAGLVIARWFVPRSRPAAMVREPAEAKPDPAPEA